jgi:hypothetical protein
VFIKNLVLKIPYDQNIHEAIQKNNKQAFRNHFILQETSISFKHYKKH